MRCKEALERLQQLRTQEIPAAVCEHLAVCPACQVRSRQWRVLCEGFQALAEEEVPQASVGFVDRLVRRLEEASRAGNAATEFLELVGRRVVLATLLLTLAALLALALPSGGPLRGADGTDPSLAQAEEVSDPVFGPDVLNQEAAPAGLFTPADKGKR